MFSALATTETNVIFKLESVKGTLLGTVIIPRRWADHLACRSVIQFPAKAMKSLYSSDTTDKPLRIAILALSHGAYGESLVLYGMTPAEFERLPGCAFMPGANYLESVIE